MRGIGDPSEDAAVATIVFLLDGKLVLLTPAKRSESDSSVSDLKYDMKVLSDKVEWFMVPANQPDQPQIFALNNSIWAWDGFHISVQRPSLRLQFLTLDLVISRSISKL